MQLPDYINNLVFVTDSRSRSKVLGEVDADLPVVSVVNHRSNAMIVGAKRAELHLAIIFSITRHARDSRRTC